MNNSTSQPTPTESRSTEFVAVPGGSDTTPASTVMVSAYVVMWALLLGFVFLTWRRQQRIDARLGELDRALARSGPDTRP